MINWPKLRMVFVCGKRQSCFLFGPGLKCPCSDWITLQGFLTEKCMLSLISEKHESLLGSQVCWNSYCNRASLE